MGMGGSFPNGVVSNAEAVAGRGGGEGMGQAVDVGAEQGLKVGPFGVGEGTEMPQTGVGDHNIEAAKVVEGLLRGGKHRAGVAHIGADGETLTAGGGDLLDEGLQPGRVAGGGDHAQTAPGEGEGGRCPDSTGRAGDQYDFAGAHGVPFMRRNSVYFTQRGGIVRCRR